ncbi:MAG: spermidine/putrescine ABC transporter substrate-binding protein [Candidatus Accumulibacter sp.]|uniref:polyamine ABC transporter substrate-binding protein n=1 Tax=Accumulibacter sp. TaxID=2053492 RepID=UPI001A3C0446|nr:spermidine/putrescine ABC transporter substrate-binding protein [Accumulibacter sp.]MBL8394761.1 spermidine/putrescine ABC transporter substrate-binding protein [Accumulibacter sp.]
MNAWRATLIVLSLTLMVSGSHAADVLHLYIWNTYLSEETAARFEARCGCRLKQDFYSDNEEMLAKLEAGAIGYDLLVPTGNAVETLLRQQALQPLDKNRLPNLGNIKAEFRNPWYDPGMRYAVPYATTVTVLGYNATRLSELGLPTDSWALIFEPRYLDKLKGKVTVLNSQRELMGAAMKYLGYSVQETDPARWDEAKRLILRTKPYWATFSNSTYIKDLAVGTIWVAHGYSSDMYRAQQDARDAGRPFNIAFRTPKEGAVLAVDSFVLHKSGRRPDLAHQFINFMLDGANAADVSNLIGAGNPNAAARPYIAPGIAGNPGIFPPAADLQRLEMLRDFDPKTRRLLSRMWTEIKVR